MPFESSATAPTAPTAPIAPPDGSAAATLELAEGALVVEPLGGGRSLVTLRPYDPALFLPRRSVETTLPFGIVADLARRSFTRVCDTLARHEDPQYVIRAVADQLAAYCDAGELAGRRLLDFGCGTGASTLCIAAAYPATEVVGVELDPEHVEIARRIAAARGLGNVQFLVSPDGGSLPAGIGSFDFVMLSAVYEHLLPAERRTVLPLIWRTLRPGGVLFVNQTPYRYFPYEHHSTGLWLINYLPAPVALWLARRFSRINREDNRRRDWQGHLRAGIRGGTEGEICRDLELAGAGKPVVLQPKAGDRAAYWLAQTGAGRWRALKTLVAAGFRLCDRWLGTIPSVNLDVALRKSFEPLVLGWQRRQRDLTAR